MILNMRKLLILVYSYAQYHQDLLTVRFIGQDMMVQLTKIKDPASPPCRERDRSTKLCTNSDCQCLHLEL